MPDSPKMVQPALIVLKALFAGQRVQLDEYSYGYDPQSGRVYMVGMAVYMGADGHREEEIWLDPHLDLNAFLRLTSNMSPDDLFILGVQTVLTEGVRTTT